MAEQNKRPSWVEHHKEPGEFPPGFRPEPGTFVPPKDGPKPPKVPPHFGQVIGYASINLH